MFQLTCPHEAGTQKFGIITPIRAVSTHVPARGGHLEARLVIAVNAEFQLTCPHEAGTVDEHVVDEPVKVSTHVPARGGHFWQCTPDTIYTKFQLTCPHEAGTDKTEHSFLCSQMFQLTCPHEAGTSTALSKAGSALVSTHVPARGGHAGSGWR